MKRELILNWTLRSKIFVCYFLILLFVALFAALVIKNYGTVISLYDDINGRYYQTEKYAKALTYRILDRQASIRGYLLTGKADYLIGYDDDVVPIRTLLAKLQALHVGNSNYHTLIKDFKDTIDEWEEKIAEVEIDKRQYLDYGLISNKEFAVSIAEIDEKGRSCLIKIKDITHNLVQNAEQDIGGKYREASIVGNETRTLIIVAAFGSLFLSAIVGLLLSNHITAPLAKLVESARLFSKGDLSRPVLLQRSDELGRLASSVDHMRRELKNSIETISRSEKKYSLLVQNANDGIVVIQDMKYLFVNKKFCEITGYDAHDLIGMDFYMILAPGSAERIKWTYERRILSEDVRSIYAMEIVRKDRTVRFIEINTVVADFENRKSDLVVVRDITLKRAYEERMRKFSEEVIKTQEEERKRISRELHDEVGQCLSAINLYVQKIEMENNRLSNSSLKLLGDIRGLVDKTVDEIHRISYDLRPYLLDDLGLFPALEWQMERFCEQTGIRPDFQIDGVQRNLSLVIETLIYRIIQEGLTNVRKHADAENVAMQMTYLPDAITLKISDDGKGFDLKKQKRKCISGKGGLGITNIRERLVLFDGYLNMRSARGEGTDLMISIPVVNSSS